MEAVMLSNAETGEAVELPIIEFVAPMPGFPEHRRFVLVRLDDSGLLYWLVSAEEPDLRFLVMPPLPRFPEYEPEIDDETVAALGDPGVDQVVVLLVVTTGETPEEASVNLMAPVVVAQHTRRAAQVVLAGSGLPVRAPLATG